MRVTDFRIYKKENNLDGIHNLDELPEVEAVYGIFGRINGEPCNCRYVGSTENLRKSIAMHFSDKEAHDCLRQFMLSIKIKTINYELMPRSTKQERLEKQKLWEAEFKPDCNEELNQVY